MRHLFFDKKPQPSKKDNIKNSRRPNMISTLKKPATRVEVYKSEDRKWRWRLISKAQIRTESPQGYVSKQGCIHGFNKARNLMQEAQLVEL